jgi:hypothetical protein
MKLSPNSRCIDRDSNCVPPAYNSHNVFSWESNRIIIFVASGPSPNTLCFTMAARKFHYCVLEAGTVFTYMLHVNLKECHPRCVCVKTNGKVVGPSITQLCLPIEW